MEIHKPKPVHNWREFLTEIGVVVIGVCIALSAEQAVEWVHWRNQVSEARGIIASEMAGNLAGAIARLGAQACVESRLDELGRILDQASRTGSLPPIGDIAMPPLRNWSTGAWESIVASQTATHFPWAELADLAITYYFVQRIFSYVPPEVQAWYELAAMVGPGRRLDPASEAELRKALGLARGYSRSMTTLSYNLVSRLEPHNLPYGPDDLGRIAAARHDIAGATPGNAQSAFAICRPIGAVPPQYGQAGTAVPPAIVAKGLTLLPGGAGAAP
jgi:hypothetical protein